jgi:hypothetical protein
MAAAAAAAAAHRGHLRHQCPVGRRVLRCRYDRDTQQPGGLRKQHARVERAHPLQPSQHRVEAHLNFLTRTGGERHRESPVNMGARG